MTSSHHRFLGRYLEGQGGPEAVAPFAILHRVAGCPTGTSTNVSARALAIVVPSLLASHLGTTRPAISVSWKYACSKPPPDPRRTRARELRRAGQTHVQIAAAFGINRMTAARWTAGLGRDRCPLTDADLTQAIIAREGVTVDR